MLDAETREAADKPKVQQTFSIVLVAHAAEKFDDEGNFTDEEGRRFVRQMLENLAEMITASGSGIVSTLR